MLAAVILYAAAIAGIIFGVFGFINGSLSHRTVYLMLFCLCAAIWAISMATIRREGGIFDFSTDAMLTVYQIMLTAAFIVWYLIMLFCMSLTRIPKKLQIIVLVSTVAYLSFITFLCLISRDFLINPCDTNLDTCTVAYMTNTSVGWAFFMPSVAVATIYSMIFLFIAYAQAQSGPGKQSIKRLIIFSIIAATISVFSNVIGPAIGIDGLNWLAALGILLIIAGSYNVAVKLSASDL